jgi:predicted site-specific integrase-resolvase
MNHERYISGAEIKKRFQVSNSTLRRWANQGRVPVVRFNDTGKRLYERTALEAALGSHREDIGEKIVYARVSSSHQREDLERQIEDLRSNFPTHRVISDIGSGINFKRPGMQTILELAMSGKLSEVVVMHRDRLARFGVELFETIFKRSGTKFVVFGKDNTTPTGELAEDLLAITTVFVARHNGARSAANRKRRKTTGSNQEVTPGKSSEDSRVPDKGTAGKTRKVDGCSQVDVQPVCGFLDETGMCRVEKGTEGIASE